MGGWVRPCDMRVRLLEAVLRAAWMGRSVFSFCIASLRSIFSSFLFGCFLHSRRFRVGTKQLSRPKRITSDEKERERERERPGPPSVCGNDSSSRISHSVTRLRLRQRQRQRQRQRPSTNFASFLALARPSIQPPVGRSVGRRQQRRRRRDGEAVVDGPADRRTGGPADRRPAELSVRLQQRALPPSSSPFQRTYERSFRPSLSLSLSLSAASSVISFLRRFRRGRRCSVSFALLEGFRERERETGAGEPHSVGGSELSKSYSTHSLIHSQRTAEQFHLLQKSSSSSSSSSSPSSWSTINTSYTDQRSKHAPKLPPRSYNAHTY